MMSQPLFQNTFVLRRPTVAIFADIIKIVTMFTLKIQKKVKQLEIMYKIHSISVFIDIAKFAGFR